MKKNILTIGLLMLVIFISLVGCATIQPQSRNIFKAEQLSTISYGKRADTFVIIQDTSSSMNEEYMGLSKIGIAKETLSNMNQTIPRLDFNAGLTAFGTGCVKKAETFYGLTAYDSEVFGGALAKLACAGGTTPLGAGIEHANSELLTKSDGLGQIAVFIVSDGAKHIQDPSNSGDPHHLEAAKELKSRLGDKVCIYPIQIGDELGGKQLMDEIAGIGDCGFATNSMEISSPKTMADYVVKTLLGPLKATRVDASPDKITFAADALFDFDKAILKPEGKQSLDNLMIKLENVKYDVIVTVGYTDRIGFKDYNKRLSVRRANAVKSYLVANQGVDASNVFVDGKGEANPVTGTTCIGKRKDLISCLQPDRRVEIEIAGVQK